MLCIFFNAKHVPNNTQVVLKVSDAGLTITSQPIGITLNTVKQASFHAHFEDDKHHGMSDWEITLIDQTESVDNLRRRESFWQYELDTFQPNGLNERGVALFLCVYLLNIYIVFNSSGLTHYIYCSTLISTIILRVLIILLFTLTVIFFNLIIVITITIFLFISFKIYLFVYILIYLLIRGPTRLERSPFRRFFNPGMLRVEGVSWHSNVCL